MNEKELESHRKGYSEGYNQAETDYFKQSEKDRQNSLELGKQLIINYITEILYNASLSDEEALTEIMKYCDVYNGGNNDE